MADKLPPGHGVDAHKDKMGKVMHEHKRGQLRSGTGKKGKKGKVVKSREQAIAIGLSYVEKLMAMGYSEEAAHAFAEFAFFESKRAAEVAAEGPTSDIDSTPGKQKGNSGRQKQPPQGSVADFPTLPNQTDNPYSEGPMVKARKGKCPPGTRSVGGGFCKNPKAGKRQYFEIEKGKSCPPGSKGAGRGRCRVDFAEGTQSTACPQPKSDAEKQAEKAQKGTQPTQPKTADASQAQQAAPQVKSVEQAAEAERKKQQREECKKMKGN